MGALTINRKRADECFSLHSPSSSLCTSYNSPNYFHYSNQIDAHISKKPRLSYSYINQTPEKKVLQQQSAVCRLQKYPEPARKFKREVHAPCRSKRFGFSSSLSNVGFQPRVSGAPRKAEQMGNSLGGSALWHRFEKTKHSALGTLRHVEVGKQEEVVDVEAEWKKGEVVSEDPSEVVTIEDGNEGRSVISDERRALGSKGLGLVLDTRELDSKAVENAVVQGSSSVVTNGNVLHSATYHDREAYKRLLSSVDKTYSPRLRSLEFEIELEEAKRRSLWSLKKQEKEHKPEQDILHELFVELTEEEKGEVKRALSNSYRRKVLVTHENSNIQITGEILQCLRPGAWLNDEVINVYMELLKERERREPKKFLNCHFFNTFFYNKLTRGRNEYDYKSVKRWTSLKKLGYKLIECDKIFVPIHKPMHWCLAVINKKDKTFQYLDSMGGRDKEVLRVLANYYVDEVKDKSGQDIDVSSWELEFVKDLPEQQNGFDCGVFMIKYADFYSRGMRLYFSQDNMPYFRVRTAKEILRLRAD